MDDSDSLVYPPDEPQPSSSHRTLPKVKLILSAPKDSKPVKASKSKKSRRGSSTQDVLKAPRPIKLKPLKEVLSKVIALIKKCVICSTQ